MSLRGRFRLLNLTVGVLCLLVCFTVGFAWLEMRRASERNSEFDQMVEAFVELEKITEAYLYLGDQGLRDQWLERHQSFERLIEKQRSSFGEDAIAGELHQYLGELKAVFEKVGPGTIAQRESAYSGSEATDKHLVRDTLNNKIHRITAITVASLARHNIEILGKKERFAFVLILVSVVLLSAAILANFIPLVRRLLASMDALRRGAASIGSGSLDYRIVIGPLKDEFDEIGVAFNSMVARLELSYSRLLETQTMLRKAYEDLEKRVERRTAALTESEERYRALFENSPNAVIVTDSSPPGNVVSANPAACRLFGFTSTELHGMDRGVLFATNDETMLSATQEGEPGEATAEITFKRNDGTLFVGECFTTFFSDSAGNRRVVYIIRDVMDADRPMRT
jgi:PAS domain S-box-containing protein